MRHISFALTTQQFLNQAKFVTRRLGWANLQPGTHLMGVEKGMGLKKGEKVKRLGEIVVERADREPLSAIENQCGWRDSVLEGFPHMPPTEFVEMFCKHNRCDPDTEVTRIQFHYAGGAGIEALPWKALILVGTLYVNDATPWRTGNRYALYDRKRMQFIPINTWAREDHLGGWPPHLEAMVAKTVEIRGDAQILPGTNIIAAVRPEFIEPTPTP